MTISKFDKPTLRVLRADFDAALKTVADKHGIKINALGIRFSDYAANVKVEMKCEGEAASVHSETELMRDLTIFGIRSKTFTYGAQAYEIVGCNLRRSKNPISARRLVTGKVYLFPPDVIQSLQKASAAA